MLTKFRIYIFWVWKQLVPVCTVVDTVDCLGHRGESVVPIVRRKGDVLGSLQLPVSINVWSADVVVRPVDIPGQLCIRRSPTRCLSVVQHIPDLGDCEDLINTTDKTMGISHQKQYTYYLVQMDHNIKDLIENLIASMAIEATNVEEDEW